MRLLVEHEEDDDDERREWERWRRSTARCERIRGFIGVTVFERFGKRSYHSYSSVTLRQIPLIRVGFSYRHSMRMPLCIFYPTLGRPNLKYIFDNVLLRIIVTFSFQVSFFQLYFWVRSVSFFTFLRLSNLIVPSSFYICYIPRVIICYLRPPRRAFGMISMHDWSLACVFLLLTLFVKRFVK